jgi:hypothetical protein
MSRGFVDEDDQGKNQDIVRNKRSVLTSCAFGYPERTKVATGIWIPIV